MVKAKIVYVTENKQVIQRTCTLPAGATVADLLIVSDMAKEHPEIQGMPTGIFSKQVTADTILREGDRVEIYRSLASDPKEKRRVRAKK